MKRNLIFSICAIMMLLSGLIQAQEVKEDLAQQVAKNWLQDADLEIAHMHWIDNASGLRIAYIFDLIPTGYLVLSAEQKLPPIIAYSFKNYFRVPGNNINPLEDMLVSDLESRLKHLDKIDMAKRQENKMSWELLISDNYHKALFEQWPPPGSTSTGGWLETNWKQSSPYNNMCPLDEVTGLRSIAGCPSIALAMIINFQKTLNGIQFSNEDDYYHSYAGRQYWIDDDAHEMEFPTFPELNEYFDSIEYKFSTYSMLNIDEITALIFSCGVAARQVYTSDVSGTFGVDQAYDAYMRFGYDDAVLVYDTDTSFYTQMKHNMIDGIPVHLAVLSNTGSGGHNVVADGYNTNDYYHLNFGWGGSYNGWYLLPDEIPYNLTIIEGAVMDIGGTHVGIESPKTTNIDFSLYPNPSSGHIYIELDLKEAGNLSIEIRDISGKAIKNLHEGTFNAGQHNLNFETNLMAGIYFISVIYKGLNTNKKLIITK